MSGKEEKSQPAAPKPKPKTKMQQMLEQQDDNLDELATGMDHLKNTTKAIHEEATEQTRLLGGMEGDTDKAQDELDKDIRLTTERIGQDQSVFKLNVIIAGEAVLLVLILLKGLM
mmetsp:Transcript_22041/g.28533  ORF Transcript_22041/g.28533 Transcript_22041/m.28533 type:complete len:115 (-) Transcript_22041:296-640(-)